MLCTESTIEQSMGCGHLRRQRGERFRGQRHHHLLQYPNHTDRRWLRECARDRCVCVPVFEATERTGAAPVDFRRVQKHGENQL